MFKSKETNSKKAVLLISMVSYLIIVLDISIVITGLPEIKETLGFTPVELSWVQNAYLLCFGGFLLLGARMGDILGRKLMLICGLAVFTVASLIIASADTPFMLISARAIQGIGAAVLAPTVLSLISTNFSEGVERNKAFARYSMVAGVGASLGLVLGGILADRISWRVGFYINVPIGIGLITAACIQLKESEPVRGSLDIVGAFTSTLGMGALVYSIVRSAETGWGDWITQSILESSLLLLIFFVIYESKVSNPIMPLRLFSSRIRAGAYIARMLFLGAMVSFFFFTTQFLQDVMGFSPMEAGIGFLPMTIPTLLAAMSVSAVTKYIGNGLIITFAFILMASGMVWLSFAGVNADYFTDLALPMFLIGLGNGAVLGPLTAAGVSGVEVKDQGAASGLVNAAHQIGGTLGLGILVTVFAAAYDPLLTGEALLSHRISSAIAGGAVMLCLGLIATLFTIVPAERTIVIKLNKELCPVPAEDRRI